MATGAVKDFSCVGGLEKHIRIVKEMVLFPLMYGDVYAKFNLRPPRGLLFYGPPGTGKTLVASALAVECSNSERKVSFISRKGSDCLSKWVGESEKKLQKIFQTAHQSRPCIIFFDEVDGLAPVRSSRQDFVHASVVSTLLALMDGLDNNSEIIVIGATNRPDAIDPALRRPGRFDRELYFPLPCYTARKEIIAIHVKSWKQKPPQKFIAYLASKTIGFCGSDLQALCTEAVMCCVRRNYPQIYTTKSKYHINEKSLKVEKFDFIKAQQNIVPASHRICVAPVKTLSPEIRPLLENKLSSIMENLQIICPTEIITSDDSSSKSTYNSTNCPRLLLCGLDDCHTRHLGPAVLHTLEHLPCHVLDVTTLFEETGRAVEESIIQKVKTARHTLPSLLYVPDILSWWDLVDEAARVVFVSLLRNLDRSVHVFVLTTARCAQNELPIEISELFSVHQREVIEIEHPNVAERRNYFNDLLLKINSDSDDSSNKSMTDEVPESLPARRCRIDSKMRSKLGTVIPERLTRSRSATAAAAASVLATSSNKRERGGSCGRAPTAKRQRFNIPSENGSKAPNSAEKLNETQTQELLLRLVQLTNGWPCYRLEILRSSLELILHSQDTELYDPIRDCLTCFENELDSYNLCTGKTLVASALAVECSNSERKVSFISRKGSDCLSKWVGESEKKLQKIFQTSKNILLEFILFVLVSISGVIVCPVTPTLLL
ncbi:ATPase family AAA domain-containing protein 2-like [Copidosoma floridanum]|uniref:ATPase family AAA domain-containing protein 2-like n=1 Tax=Copidosoma floridanum TaxID=29053 RepID=UPI000C6FB819|nr:ATPase family AAA domain-containing protein 2-like [Copidosoma floridanum]